MNIPEISINRHVFAFMLSAVIVLFGVAGYERIGIDEYPEIDFPMISITTTLIGADPNIIDSTVTNIIETAVNSTPGIEHIDSRSAPGVSVVTIKFQLSKDVDIAFNEVQAKINQIARAMVSIQKMNTALEKATITKQKNAEQRKANKSKSKKEKVAPVLEKEDTKEKKKKKKKTEKK